MDYLTLDLATAALADLRSAADVGLSDTAQTARLMYNGYHLGKPIGDSSNRVQDFTFWKGPKPAPPLDDTEQARRTAVEFQSEFQTALERSFTSTNFVRELVNREIGSIFDKMNWTSQDVSPQAVFKDKNKLSLLQQEAEALMTAWWRSHRSHPEAALRAAATFARREGRGVLRFRVAGGVLESAVVGAEQITRVRPELDFGEIARYIRLEATTDPEHCRIWEDADRLTPRAVYSYSAGGLDCAEVSSVDGDGGTLLRVVRGETASSVTLNLGGRLTYIELTLEALATPQLLQNQMAYNTASTMILRNTELAGFIERYGVNLEPPYELTPDVNNPGQMIRRYQPLKTGPGSLNLWRQATMDKVDTLGNYVGEEALGRNSQYGRFEPVSPAALTEAADHSRLNIYGEAGQAYVLMGADATASGRSREVAIADFDNIRQPTTDLAGYAIGEIQETFLALVSALGGKPGHFAGIQVTGEVRARVVPPTALERAQDLSEVQARLISAATARQRQGIDDSGAETNTIRGEIEDGSSPSLQPPVMTPKPPDDGS